MKGQRRRKVEWRRGDIDPSHAYLDGGNESVCGLRCPFTWTISRREKCANCELALKRLW